MPELTVDEALGQITMLEMQHDPAVIVLGCAARSGPFHITHGAFEALGAARVWDVPAGEHTSVGMAIGAAMTGLRPIVELGTVEQAAQALGQIADHAAKLRYRSGGSVKLPIVFSLSTGMTRAGALHSQSLETWFAHLPGLKVVMPATLDDAATLLVSAIRDDDPVIYVLDKRISRLSGQVPENLDAVPFGAASIMREGNDITVVATGWMVHESLRAAAEVEQFGISSEVINLRSLVPLDLGTILDSVRRTGRLVMVHEAVSFAGIGAEVVADVSTEAYRWLKAPPCRVGLPFVVPPAHVQNIAEALPSHRDIADAIRATVGR